MMATLDAVRIIRQPPNLFHFTYAKTQNQRMSMAVQIAAVSTHHCPCTAKLTVSCVDKSCRPLSHFLEGDLCQNGLLEKDVQLTEQPTVVEISKFFIRICPRHKAAQVLRQRKELASYLFPVEYTVSISVGNTKTEKEVRLRVDLRIPSQDAFCLRNYIHPIYSEVICGKEALNIDKVSCVSCSRNGGEEIYVLCDKFNRRDNVKVRFYEERNGCRTWESFAKFGEGDVHKNCIIVCRAPTYPNRSDRWPVRVYLELFRESDGAVSKSIPFQYYNDNVTLSSKDENLPHKEAQLNRLEITREAGPSSTFNRKSAPNCLTSSERSRAESRPPLSWSNSSPHNLTYHNMQADPLHPQITVSPLTSTTGYDASAYQIAEDQQLLQTVADFNQIVPPTDDGQPILSPIYLTIPSTEHAFDKPTNQTAEQLIPANQQANQQPYLDTPAPEQKFTIGPGSTQMFDCKEATSPTGASSISNDFFIPLSTTSACTMRVPTTVLHQNSQYEDRHQRREAVLVSGGQLEELSFWSVPALTDFDLTRARVPETEMNRTFLDVRRSNEELLENFYSLTELFQNIIETPIESEVPYLNQLY